MNMNNSQWCSTVKFLYKVVNEHENYWEYKYFVIKPLLNDLAKELRSLCKGKLFKCGNVKYVCTGVSVSFGDIYVLVKGGNGILLSEVEFI